MRASPASGGRAPLPLDAVGPCASTRLRAGSPASTSSPGLRDRCVGRGNCRSTALVARVLGGAAGEALAATVYHPIGRPSGMRAQAVPSLGGDNGAAMRRRAACGVGRAAALSSRAPRSQDQAANQPGGADSALSSQRCVLACTLTLGDMFNVVRTPSALWETFNGRTGRLAADGGRGRSVDCAVPAASRVWARHRGSRYLE